LTPSAPISRLSQYLHELGVFKRLVWPLRTESDVRYVGVSFDSRTTRPGDLFVAYQGLSRDSHAFIYEATSRGAAAVCCEYLLDRHLDVPVVLVSSGRRALSAASALLYGFPSDRLHVVGVTGTNGKTTTTCMITRCFEAAGYHTGLLGTLAYKVGEELHPSQITTPDAPDLQAMLAQMLEEGVTHVTIEVSSHALSQERVADVDFDTAVITNISSDHLDVHESIEEYLDAKARLFTELQPGSLGVYNADDHFATAICRRSPVLCIGVGRSRSALVRLRDSTLVFGEEVARAAGRAAASLTLELGVLGTHNITNSALAATVAYLHGVPIDTIRHALNSFPGLPRRLQVVYDGEYRIIDDFAHNPGSLQAVFSTLAVDPPRATIVVNALRGNRGVVVNKDNASVIATWAPSINTRMIITTLSTDVVGPKDRVTDDEFRAFTGPLEKVALPHIIHDHLETAVEHALKEVRAGELILLLGAQGMDPAGRLLEFVGRHETGTRHLAAGHFELGAELGRSSANWIHPQWESKIRTALFCGAHRSDQQVDSRRSTQQPG